LFTRRPFSDHELLHHSEDVAAITIDTIDDGRCPEPGAPMRARLSSSPLSATFRAFSNSIHAVVTLYQSR
jgi:hypothetical protein